MCTEQKFGIKKLVGHQFLKPFWYQLLAYQSRGKRCTALILYGYSFRIVAL